MSLFVSPFLSFSLFFSLPIVTLYTPSRFVLLSSSRCSSPSSFFSFPLLRGRISSEVAVRLSHPLNPPPGAFLILMIPLYSIQKYQCYPILRKIGFNYDCQARVDPLAGALSCSFASMIFRGGMWNSSHRYAYRDDCSEISQNVRCI